MSGQTGEEDLRCGGYCVGLINDDGNKTYAGQTPSWTTPTTSTFTTIQGSVFSSRLLFLLCLIDRFLVPHAIIAVLHLSVMAR